MPWKWFGVRIVSTDITTNTKKCIVVNDGQMVLTRWFAKMISVPTEKGRTMDKELAIEILKAVACCSLPELHCYECPLWDTKKHKCRPWTDDEVRDAVHTLNGERKDNG